MQVQVPPKPRTYETLLERIVDQSDDSTGFLLLMRNQILKSCNIGCNYDWKKEESFGLKDPLTECQVYWWLSKTDNEKVSKQIGEIYFSDRALIKTSVTSFITKVILMTDENHEFVPELHFKSDT